MKNTIYKNFAKKILKSEAFVSVVIVFVLALGIIGTSYALYMDIDTDTNYQLVEVGDLSIGFNNGSSKIELTNMTPTSDDVAIKGTDNLTSFYVYNDGTYTANYNIKLIPNNTNTVETKFIKYQICRDNSDNCKDINTLNETGETIIYTDELTPNSTALDTNNTNPSAYYFIRLWISDEYTVTAAQTISLNIVIDAKNASGYLDNDNTLAGTILNNPNITKNNSQPIFNGIADYVITGDSTSGELGLFKAEDDYGISYYFRGAQSNNYVNFAGFTWRIVRINGDGSIRLILDGTLDKISACDDTTFCKTTAFNSTEDDNAYVGYMYGLTGVTSDNVCVITTDEVKSIESSITEETSCTGEWMSGYDATHMNLHDSTIKTQLDLFYQKYLNTYNDYISDTMFCGDKTLASNGIGGVTTQLGYGTGTDYITYYAASERLWYSSGTTSVTNANPTLKCAEKADNTYSRYTVNGETTSKGVETNGDLTYPIALLSADELVMAGAFKTTKNQSYYLYDAYANSLSSSYWWTMSLSHFNGSDAYEFNSISTGYSLRNNFVINSSSGSRPVINLRSDILVGDGDGTKDITYDEEGNVLTKGPYTVKLY